MPLRPFGTQQLKNAILSGSTCDEKVTTLKKLSELLKRTISEEGAIEPEITQQPARNGKEEREPAPLEHKSSEQHLVYVTQEQLRKLEERIEFLEVYVRTPRGRDTEVSSLSPSHFFLHIKLLPAIAIKVRVYGCRICWSLREMMLKCCK